MTENGSKTTLTRDTKTTIGTAFAIGFVVLTSALWIDRRLSRLELGQESLVSAVEAVGDDRWTQTEHYYWSRLLQIENPGMTIPAVPLEE